MGVPQAQEPSLCPCSSLPWKVKLLECVDLPPCGPPLGHLLITVGGARTLRGWPCIWGPQEELVLIVCSPGPAPYSHGKWGCRTRMRGSLAESGADPLGHGGFEHLKDRVLSLAWTGLLQPDCQGSQWGPVGSSRSRGPVVIQADALPLSHAGGGGSSYPGRSAPWVSTAGNSCFLGGSGNPTPLPRPGPALQAPPETG